jgi:hypothetical protein
MMVSHPPRRRRGTACARHRSSPPFSQRPLLTLGACSDDSTESSSVESSSSPSASTASASPSTPSSEQPTKPKPSGTTINISIQGDTVEPNGSRVKVKRGEPVTLRIDADSPGELHVHSTPERGAGVRGGRQHQEADHRPPGIVDVEDHELEQVIVQLEVS